MRYAQVLRFVTVDLPEQHNDGRGARISEPDGEHLVLVVARPAALITKSRFGPISSSLGCATVIDAADIINVRVADKSTGRCERCCTAAWYCNPP